MISARSSLALLLMTVFTALSAGCIPDANPDPIDGDNDGDGIPDSKEAPGQLHLGMPLYEWGARPNQPDLFIEIDYMDSTNGGLYPLNEGTVPNEAALQRIVDVFADNGIAVHFDVGDLFDQSNDSNLNPARFDLGGGSEITYAANVDITDVRTHYEPLNSDSARTRIFYYMLFAISHDEANVLGEAYVRNRHSLITFGDFELSTVSASETNFLINVQASVVMHELGHNLGLYHGGGGGIDFSGSQTNAKPNYMSVMNYLYNYRGLPPLDTVNEGDRYYYANQSRFGSDFCNLFYPLEMNELSNSPYSNSHVLDFSHGNNAAINEFLVDETAGLGTGTGVAIDFNCDNNIVPSLANFNTKYIPPSLNTYGGPIAVQQDHDDWGNLYFYFHYYGASAAFALRGPGEDDPPIIIKEDPVPEWAM